MNNQKIDVVQQHINRYICNASGSVIYLCFGDRGVGRGDAWAWWGTPTRGLSNGVYPAMRRIYLHFPNAIECVEDEVILVKRGKAQ